jgi:hypothetical protein
MVDCSAGVEHAHDSIGVERIDRGFSAVPEKVMGPDTELGEHRDQTRVVGEVHATSLSGPLHTPGDFVAAAPCRC